MATPFRVSKDNRISGDSSRIKANSMTSMVILFRVSKDSSMISTAIPPSTSRISGGCRVLASKVLVSKANRVRNKTRSVECDRWPNNK